MQIHRRLNFRLKPSLEQEQQFSQFAGVCRLVFNLALEQRRKWGKSHGCDYHTASADLKDLRAEFDFVRAVSQTAQQQALMDLDKAFKNFFSGRASFPQPRKRGVNDSFRFMGREVKVEKLNKNWAWIKLPKIGLVKLRLSRKIDGKITDATVMRDVHGWVVSICVKREVEERERLPAEVGGDLGVAAPLTLSTGQVFHLPPELAKTEKRRKAAQKQASRRQRGSKRHEKAMRRVRKLAAKMARIRAHWQHVVSHELVENFGVVVFEALKIKNMVRSAKGTIDAPGKNVAQKAGLNRSISNVGMAGLKDKTSYKLEERSGEMRLVDPKYTSQQCSCCGAIDKESRKSQAVFLCTNCGFTMNADHNASINIHRRGSTPSACIATGTDVDSRRRHKAPGPEASTARMAA
jgi:putative transposase